MVRPAPRPLPPADAGVVLAALGVGWLAGVALQLQQVALWPTAGYVAAAVAAVAVGLAGRRAGAVPAPLSALGAALVAASVTAALFGFALTGLHATHRIADRLPQALEGRDLQVVGVVAGLPRPSPEGTRFEFEVESATLEDRPVIVPRRVLLTWSRGFDGDALHAAAPAPVDVGDRWRLPVRLRQPHGNLNPQGFDLELWLFEQRLRAVGSVRATAGSLPQRLGVAVAHPIDRWRQRSRDSILLRVADARAAGVIAALAVGDQAAIDRDDWALFRDTGVAHLMSISGLHVTMLGWLAARLVGRLWRFGGRAMLFVAAPAAARWGGVAAAAAYAVFAGWGVPAQRTVWMLVTVALLHSTALRWPSLLVLLAAAVVVTAFDPWALLQPGFWLSFVAVALLIAAEPERSVLPPARDASWRRHARDSVRGALRAQAVASVGLAPLSMVFFRQVSIVGFAANLVAIPLVTLLVTPLALAGIVAPVLWQPAAWLVEALTTVLASFAALPGGQWSAAAAPAWGAVAGLFGGALLVTPLPWRLRLLGVPLLLPLLLPTVARPDPGTFEAVVADVGQGTAVLVRTHAHLLVYDAGPRYTPESDAGQRVLLPLLRARGERRIDRLVLSHRDTDHVGGAAALISGLDVGGLLTSLESGHPLLATGLPHRRCAAGESWHWDGVRFDVLHPLPDAAAPKPNALSCVLRVEDGDGRSLLLTGDIEAAQESALVDREGRRLRAQVLVVPHHGSRTSSTEAFIEAVAPGTALVQAGYRNRFGHPAAEVVDRYRALGVELLRTDHCGAWTWDAQGSTRCERDAQRRYWHHRPDGDVDPPG